MEPVKSQWRYWALLQKKADGRSSYTNAARRSKFLPPSAWDLRWLVLLAAKRRVRCPPRDFSLGARFRRPSHPEKRAGVCARSRPPNASASLYLGKQERN